MGSLQGRVVHEHTTTGDGLDVGTDEQVRVLRTEPMPPTMSSKMEPTPV